MAAATGREQWDDRYLEQATRSVASRVRKHGVAFPGTSAAGPQRPRKKPRTQKKKKKTQVARPPPLLPAAAPTKQGSKGAVTKRELEPYLKGSSWPCGATGPVIKVGSDCSGLESVLTALDQLGLGRRVRAEFVCDKDPLCRKVLRSVHEPRVVYDDVTKRDVKDMPQVDLYTAGFPCQPWSSEGKGDGRCDKQGRGLIFDHVLKYINEKLPKCFLLENVVALSQATHKKAFEKMLASLRRSEEYFVTWRVVNAVNFGIPQNRPRVFIVGLLRSAVSQPSFPWPKPATRSPLPLTRFLCGGAGVIRPLPGAGTVASGQLQRGLEAIRAEKGNPRTTDYSLDIWSGRDYPGRMTDRVPCITRTRGGAGGYYITSVRRLLTVEEMLNLQGLPLSYRAVARREGVSDRQLGMMVGNAIATNVLRAILPRMLTKIGKQ